MGRRRRIAALVARPAHAWALALALAAGGPCEAGDAWGEPAPLVEDNARTAPRSDRPPAARRRKAEPAEEPKVEQWPESALHGFSLQAEKLSDALFDLVEDVELISVRAGDGRVRLRTGRRVFDNHDVLGSWTVVDHLRLSASYPFYSVNWPVFGNLTGGYRVGGSVGNEFIDIRQVLPRDFARLPTLDARRAEVEAWAQPAPQPEPREDDGLQPFAGLEQARWGRLWNMLTFPARSPTQASWLSRLEDGEVISFVAEGTIETGPVLTWGVDLARYIDWVHAELSLATYVSGRFRISILREDARYAKVRLTRLAEAGASASAGARTEELITGFTVGRFDLARSRSVVTPFSFTVRNGKGRSLDLVYRFDLQQPQGRAAYEQAVSGRFALSDRLAGGADWKLAPADAAVRKVGTRSSAYTNAFKGSGTRWGLLYRHNHESTVVNAEVVADFPDRTLRLFRADTVNARSFRFIWGVFGRWRYDFRFNVDRDRADAGAPDAATLTVRADITDSDTGGDELHQYMDEAEAATGRAAFFPRPPKYRPDPSSHRLQPDDVADRRRRDRSEGDPLDYYRSSFFYQLTLSQAQIERFMNVPEARMWQLLEAAFGARAGAWSDPGSRFAYDLAHLPERGLNIPLYAFNIHYREGSMLSHARTMRDAWRAARSQTQLEARIGALAAMFSDRRYSTELVRLLRLALQGERVSYVIQGSSHAFGYMRDEGTGEAPLDPAPETIERRIDFDAQEARPRADPEAELRELGMEPLGDGRYRLTFTVDAKTPPRALYASLIEVRPWRFPRAVGHSAWVDREGAVVAGRNVLVLSREAGPLSDLLARIEPGNAYVLKLAYSRDGRTWGPIGEARFTVQP